MPEAIEFNHFKQSEGTRAKIRPTHPFMLLPMPNSQINAFLHSARANGFASLFATLIIDNFGMMFGRFSLDVEHRSIWFDETLLGEHFREEELRFAIEVVSTTADAWDDRLKQMFGGVTYQEMLAGHATEARPTTKPGEGVGMYL